MVGEIVTQPHQSHQPGYGSSTQPADGSKKFLNISGGALMLMITAIILLCCVGPCVLGLFGGVMESISPSSTPSPMRTIKIGQTARDGKFEFTVTKVKRGKTQIGSADLGVTAQGEFVLIHITVKNIGDEPQDFIGSNQRLYDTSGKKYSVNTEAAIYMPDSESLWEEINPGNKVNGVIVYDVSKTVKLAKLELHDSVFSEGVEVTLT